MIISSLCKLFERNEIKENNSRPYIPDDLLLNILSRVPATPLLRFKSVNRDWYSLISSNEFRQRHLQHHADHPDQRYGIIQIGNAHTLQPSLLLRIMGIADDHHELVEIGKVHGHQLVFGSFFSPRVFGSCNGLLLISLSLDLQDFIVWNPTIRAHRKIDRNISDGPRDDVLYMAGLGYNCLNDNYKIVVAESGNLHDNSIEVQIYDLKLSSWKIIKRYFPYEFKSSTTPATTMANGIPHWHVKRMIDDDQSVILSFDLVAEKFEEINLPENILNFNYMSAIDGCLCIGIRESLSRPVYVWQMREYGRKNSWIKLEIVLPHVVRGGLYSMPIGFLGTDQVVMSLGRAWLAIFDVSKRQYKFVMQSWLNLFHTVASFDETFVSPY
ncbi:F-box protein CPR1-like [Mercurialis annua]|uniref:F-box protein CPR1-like n=1 Tax=Mercurialis annua TaxID=3986 RepID=UPI00215F024E|nr:F-box protein CPR1-like [Mercurialis annua]XP_050230293.1 F-box protein CPR1-like [Mercurialis annua]